MFLAVLMVVIMQIRELKMNAAGKERVSDKSGTKMDYSEGGEKGREVTDEWGRRVELQKKESGESERETNKVSGLDTVLPTGARPKDEEECQKRC